MSRLRGYVYPENTPGIDPVKARAGYVSMDVDWIENPTQADFFFVPGDGVRWTKEELVRLPFWSKAESRHAMVCTGDLLEPYGTNAIVFRCSVDERVMAQDPQTVPWPYPVEDFGALVGQSEFSFETTFHGFDTDLRRAVANSALAHCKADVRLHREFWGYLPERNPALAEERRRAFLHSIKISKTVLAPRGQSFTSYRMFEAMSAGRVPVLVSPSRILPFADRIPWGDISLWVHQDSADLVGPHLRGWLDAHGSEVTSIGCAGRKAWEEYLDGKLWPRLMAEEIRRRI